MKKQKILIVSLVSLAAVIALIAAPNSLAITPAEQANTIVLNSANAFTTSEISAQTATRNTQLGNPIGFKLSADSSMAVSESGSLKFVASKNGWLANTTAISGIESISVTANAAGLFRIDLGFEQDLTSYAYNESPSYVIHSTNNQTGASTYNLTFETGRYTYFRLQSLGTSELDVSNITINYACETVTKNTIWEGVEVLPNTEGWNGSTKGGATVNVLPYADRSTKNLLGMFPYSGSGSIKVPNFLAGLSEDDTILEVVSRCSTSTNYCDGVKLHYAKPLAFEDFTRLEVEFYSTATSHGGYCFYIKDSAGHHYDWRIQTSAYTAYAWTKLTLDVTTLTGAGLSDIKTIDLVAVGTAADPGLTCTYAGYKYCQLAKDEAPENFLSNVEILPNTEGWNGSTKGGATIHVLPYEERSTTNLLGSFPYSGTGSCKVPNFLAGLNEGDVVLEVLSRCSTSTSYCDGAKLSYNTALTFNDSDKLEIEFYSTTVGHGGYCFYIKDSAGNHYDWRIQTSAYTAYAWTKLTLDASTLATAGLTNIKTIDLVAVGTAADPGLTCTYAGYKMVQLVKEAEPENFLSNVTLLPNTEGWNGSTKGGATINVLSYADRETKNLLGMFPYSGTGSVKVPNFLAGLNEGDVVLEVVSRCSTSTSYCDGAKLSYNTALAFGENNKLEVEFYSTATSHGGYCFYIKDSAGHNYDWRIQTSAYTAYAWTKLTLDVTTLTGAGLSDIKTIDLVAVGTAADPGLTCTYAGYKTVQLAKVS